MKSMPHRRTAGQVKIFTVAIGNMGAEGARVSPQIFTSTQELDTFVRALRELAS
jgi:selenocysteine lyase/cysteine desulfurase